MIVVFLHLAYDQSLFLSAKDSLAYCREISFPEAAFLLVSTNDREQNKTRRLWKRDYLRRRILVPQNRHLFGQHQGSRPLAGSNTESAGHARRRERFRKSVSVGRLSTQVTQACKMNVLRNGRILRICTGTERVKSRN